MQKIIVMISTVAVLALATFSANACPFDEHSASLKQDQVASALPDSSKATTSEAMSTFDPKHSPLFEDIVEAIEKSTEIKEITE
jgi:hypothetical protein